MVALSSNMFSTMGWPLEEIDIQLEELLASCTTNSKQTAEASSHYSLSISPTPQEALELRDKEGLNTTKKSSHNAYERDRRKKMNELYSSLRDLLPESDQRKNLSIPSTISRVLKYIPELQRHIERLVHRKEEILLGVSRITEHPNLNNSSGCDAYRSIVSVTCNKGEIMFQISVLNKAANKSFSRVLRVFEEKGLQLLNATTLSSHGDRSLYSVCLQAKEPTSMGCDIFCKQLTEIVKEQADAE